MGFFIENEMLQNLKNKKIIKIFTNVIFYFRTQNTVSSYYRINNKNLIREQDFSTYNHNQYVLLIYSYNIFGGLIVEIKINTKSNKSIKLLVEAYLLSYK